MVNLFGILIILPKDCVWILYVAVWEEGKTLSLNVKNADYLLPLSFCSQTCGRQALFSKGRNEHHFFQAQKNLKHEMCLLWFIDMSVLRFVLSISISERWQETPALSVQNQNWERAVCSPENWKFSSCLDFENQETLYAYSLNSTFRSIIYSTVPILSFLCLFHLFRLCLV